MALSVFPDTPENFHNQPIVLEKLGTTGLLAGDDSGYRQYPVFDTGEELVRVDDEVMTRPYYDGFDEVTGEYDERLVLPAGTEGIYARRSVLEAIKVANKYLAERYGRGTHARPIP